MTPSAGNIKMRISDMRIALGFFALLADALHILSMQTRHGSLSLSDADGSGGPDGSSAGRSDAATVQTSMLLPEGRAELLAPLAMRDNSSDAALGGVNSQVTATAAHVVTAGKHRGEELQCESRLQSCAPQIRNIRAGDTDLCSVLSKAFTCLGECAEFAGATKQILLQWARCIEARQRPETRGASAQQPSAVKRSTALGALTETQARLSLAAWISNATTAVSRAFPLVDSIGLRLRWVTATKAIWVGTIRESERPMVDSHYDLGGFRDSSKVVSTEALPQTSLSADSRIVDTTSATARTGTQPEPTVPVVVKCMFELYCCFSGALSAPRSERGAPSAARSFMRACERADAPCERLARNSVGAAGSPIHSGPAVDANGMCASSALLRELVASEAGPTRRSVPRCCSTWHLALGEARMPRAAHSFALRTSVGVWCLVGASP